MYLKGEGTTLERSVGVDIVENRKPTHSVQPFKPSLIDIFINNVPMLVQDCTINKPRRGRREDKLYNHREKVHPSSTASLAYVWLFLKGV